MKKLALFAGLLLVLTPVGSVSAQSTRVAYDRGTNQKSSQPLLPSDEAGLRVAQKKLQVELVFASTPGGETDQKLGQPLLPADVEQLNILQSWVTEGSLEGLDRYPISTGFPQQRLSHCQPEGRSDH